MLASVADPSWVTVCEVVRRGSMIGSVRERRSVAELAGPEGVVRLRCGARDLSGVKDAVEVLEEISGEVEALRECINRLVALEGAGGRERRGR